MMLDRPYSVSEIAQIGARASVVMEADGIPGTVVLTAHLLAASAMLEDALTVGPLSPTFHAAARALSEVAKFFVVICERGPTGGETTPS